MLSRSCARTIIQLDQPGVVYLIKVVYDVLSYSTGLQRSSRLEPVRIFHCYMVTDANSNQGLYAEH